MSNIDVDLKVMLLYSARGEFLCPNSVVELEFRVSLEQSHFDLRKMPHQVLSVLTVLFVSGGSGECKFRPGQFPVLPGLERHWSSQLSTKNYAHLTWTIALPISTVLMLWVCQKDRLIAGHNFRSNLSQLHAPFWLDRNYL